MKRIHYASGSLLTGDAIAEVLLRYAAALAADETAVELRAPALAADGSASPVLLLLGPASQMFAENEASEYPELEDADFVADCEKRIRVLGPSRADYVTDGVDDTSGFDLDYL